MGLWDIAKEQQVHSFQGHSHFVTGTNQANYLRLLCTVLTGHIQMWRSTALARSC